VRGRAVSSVTKWSAAAITPAASALFFAAGAVTKALAISTFLTWKSMNT